MRTFSSSQTLAFPSCLSIERIGGKIYGFMSYSRKKYVQGVMIKTEKHHNAVLPVSVSC